jgi:hypothetical protein
VSVSLPIDVGDVLRPGEETAGTVVVRLFGFAHTTAACTCGWRGKRRYLKAVAVQDAWMHSIHEHCTVAVPLVQPALAG